MDFIKKYKTASIIIASILLIALILTITGYIDDVALFIFGTLAVIIGVTLSIVIPLILIILGIALYCLPIIIGILRKHSNLSPIILVNLLLGWSLVGWVVALVWSFTDNTK